MKKISSLLMAVLIVASMLSITSVAFAKDPILSPTAPTYTTAPDTTKPTKPDTTKPTKPDDTTVPDNVKPNGGANTTVNGADSNDISHTPLDPSTGSVTFTYGGDGTVIRWETNLEDLGLVEGVDYTVTYNSDGTVTIHFMTQAALDAWNDGTVTVNAEVDFTEETTAPTTKKDKDKKPTSPDTGISTATAAAGIALAGAGLAVIVASKKNDAE